MSNRKKTRDRQRDLPILFLKEGGEEISTKEEWEENGSNTVIFWSEPFMEYGRLTREP